MDSAVAQLMRRLQAAGRTHRNRRPDSYQPSSEDPENLSLSVDGLSLDWSLQRADDEVLRLLSELGDRLDLPGQLRQQFAGNTINVSENRAALHSAMRGTPTKNELFDAQVQQAHINLLDFANRILNANLRSYSGEPFTDILHIGIGGSHLGQQFLCDALASTRLRIHFLSSTHTSLVEPTLRALTPSTTLVIVASKSFTTPETQQNYQTVRQWFAERTNQSSALASNFVLISSNDASLSALPGHRFQVPQEVGGRFSVWSAMGLPVVLALGPKRFNQLRQGAAAMDCHASAMPSARNAPVMLALLAFWNTNCLGVASHAVLAYSANLRWLVAYLQQLEMESLGKSMTTQNQPVSHPTTGVVWGGHETDGQHAWHQWLHQGTHAFSADFIATAAVQNTTDRWMLANCLAQRQVMFFGHTDATAPEKTIQGGHGSTLILLDQTDATTLGMLIALFEHKVACLGHLWQINPFDQWGVERSKLIAAEVDAALAPNGPPPSNALLTKQVRKIKTRQK